MGYKNDDRCLDAADDDEPIFVGLGRDPLAAVMTELWAAMSARCQPEGQVVEARTHAARMLAYCEARNPGREVERVDDRAICAAINFLRRERDRRMRARVHAQAEQRKAAADGVA